jgi:hypothetical protein
MWLLMKIIIPHKFIMHVILKLDFIENHAGEKLPTFEEMRGILKEAEDGE